MSDNDTDLLGEIEYLKVKYVSIGPDLIRTYDRLSEIVRAKPELAKNVFKAFKTGLANEKNNEDSLGGAYDVLSDFKKDVELRYVQQKLQESQQALSRERQALSESRQALSESQQKTAEATKEKDMFLEGNGIAEMPMVERTILFHDSDLLRREHPVMQELALTTMCRCYMAEKDKKTKLEFLKTLYQIRKEGKTNKEKNEMADTFARVLNRAPELKCDNNLVRLSQRDTVVKQPTRAVRRQVESAGK